MCAPQYGIWARIPAPWARHAAAQAGSSRRRRPGASCAKKADRTGCGPARSLVGSQIGSKQGIGGAPTDPRARAHQHPFLAATKESVVRLRHAAEKQSAAASLLLLFAAVIYFWPTVSKSQSADLCARCVGRCTLTCTILLWTRHATCRVWDGLINSAFHTKTREFRERRVEQAQARRLPLRVSARCNVLLSSRARKLYGDYGFPLPIDFRPEAPHMGKDLTPFP